MKLNVHKTKLEEILPFRNLFLQETNFQIRYDACHERGWTDCYFLTLDDKDIGYGSIKGQEIKDRDTIFEFYVVPPFRKLANRIFPELIAVSRANLIECQSNDLFMSHMMYEFAKNINADVVLFEDDMVTDLAIPAVVFRPRKEGDQIIEHSGDPGAYVLDLKGEIVASGGFLLHYNMPFADLYMEVREDYRRKGFGSYILQEIKKECYLSGRIPAARCNIQNKASRATLIKAGMKVCGFMLIGDIKNANS